MVLKIFSSSLSLYMVKKRERKRERKGGGERGIWGSTSASHIGGRDTGT